MTEQQEKEGSQFRRLWCHIFSHDPTYVAGNIEPRPAIRCSRCGQKWVKGHVPLYGDAYSEMVEKHGLNEWNHD